MVFRAIHLQQAMFRNPARKRENHENAETSNTSKSLDLRYEKQENGRIEKLRKPKECESCVQAKGLISFLISANRIKFDQAHHVAQKR